MLEPKTRNVDAEMLMEQLFRLTELEVRVPLNLNVLDPAGVPRVMSLKEVLQAFLDHRREVLLRRSRHRLAAVARRIEVLRGQIIVYLNLDEVIRIIRESRRPESRDDGALGADATCRPRRSSTCGCAPCAGSRRSRSARSSTRWRPRRRGSSALLASERRQWRAIAKEVARDRSRIRRRHAARPPAHRARRGAGAGRDPGRGAGRARAGDRAAARQRAGSARSRGTTARPPSRNTRKATGRASRSPPRPPTG